jgi:hypothetical protein
MRSTLVLSLSVLSVACGHAATNGPSGDGTADAGGGGVIDGAPGVDAAGGGGADGAPGGDAAGGGGVDGAPGTAPGAAVYSGCEDPPTKFASTLMATPSTWTSVLGTAAAGDVISLDSGNYGAVSISNKKYSDFLTIHAATGKTPVFSSFAVSSSSHLVVDGITVIGGGVRANTPGGTLVTLASSDNIVFRNSTVESTSGTFPWQEQTGDLTTLDSSIAPSDGINASQGYCIAITGNTIRNVFNGIYGGGDETGTDGQNYLVSSNSIDQFAGDGIDHSASNILIQSNHITNSLDICNLQCIHNDGIQGWNWDDRLGITNQNVVIDSNFIESQTSTSLNLASVDLHGISIFDGFWKNVSITNNAVLTSSDTGISIAGVGGLQVVNNTVMNIPLNGSAPVGSNWEFNGITWITLGGTTHEGGTTSAAIARNNIGSLIAPTESTTGNCPYTESYCPHTPDPAVEQDHNISLVQTNSTLQQLFVMFDTTSNQYDLHLVGTAATNPAIGTGSASLMPSTDITGAARSSSSVDLGAYAAK